jgi:hypothetical protein
MKTETMQKMLRSNHELTPLVRIEIARRLDQYVHELSVQQQKKGSAVQPVPAKPADSPSHI